MNSEKSSEIARNFVGTQIDCFRNVFAKRKIKHLKFS